jgi:WD40 repeat protein/DNA-binding XRE family transcriptional regulator
MTEANAADRAPEPFNGLLLRHRGRTGLTQRQLAARVGVNRRALQDWEEGVNCPSAQRLQALLAALLAADGLTTGHEADEAAVLWAAALLGSTRMHVAFDHSWFGGLLADHAARRVAGRPGGRDEPVGGAPPAVARSLGPVLERRQDWGDAPDLRAFVGRPDELATVRDWILLDHCRLVCVLGIGGIGKTSLAGKLAQELAPAFQRVYWRGLRNAPPYGDWLAGAIGFLSGQQRVPPAGDAERRAVLLDLLRAQPSLLVLDNFETVLEPVEREGRYRDGLDGYGALLRAVGEASHESCLLVTSREAPPELAVLDGTAGRSLTLGGLDVPEGRTLLATKRLAGDDQAWARLIERYGGNGLALKVVGESIRELFGGEIDSFLEEAGASNVFGGIRRLLGDQVTRGSALEQQVLHLLAVAREPVTLAELLDALGPSAGRGAMLEAVEALRRRSLVERAETPGVAAFTLQSLVLEYLTEQLVEIVADEIARGQPMVTVEQPLIQAQAKDYVRQTQERLIGAPILQGLNVQHAEAGAERRLLALLDTWRGRAAAEQGYGPGNVVNLLRLLRGDLRGIDLSRLAVRQAYLQGVEAQDASLAGAELAGAVLDEPFAYPTAVALNADGTVLVAGTPAGDVRLWRTAHRTLLLAVPGHTGMVWAVAVSGDGRLVASGGDDGLVRLWEAESSQLLATMHAHTGPVWGVALSADGQLVASGGEDALVRLWDSRSGQLLASLQGHTGGVRAVALSGDGRLLASGGDDLMLRIWHVETGQQIATLQGHTGVVYGLALSDDGGLVVSGSVDGTVRLWKPASGEPPAILQAHPGGLRGVAVSGNGRLAASGGGDGLVRLWDTGTEHPLANMLGHTGAVWCMALSADGWLVASGSQDGTIRLWEAGSGRLLAAVQGHTGVILSVALVDDGRLVASGGVDGMVRLWESGTGRLLAALRGHSGLVRGVALNADGRLVASAGDDGIVRLWKSGTGQLQATLVGHNGTVWCMALSADGQRIASGGVDDTVRLWDAQTRQMLATLQGHSSLIWGVALSADGRLAASSSLDGTVRLWDAEGGQLLTTLQGDTGTVWGVTLSGDGRLVACGCVDGTVRLWETRGGQIQATLRGHSGLVYAVALSFDGRLLASGGADGMVKLWDTASGQLLATLRGHTGVVWSVALSRDGRLLASGGDDGILRLWDTVSSACRRTLRADRRYERLDITGLSGVTDAQHAALLALGAIVRPRS